MTEMLPHAHNFGGTMTYSDRTTFLHLLHG